MATGASRQAMRGELLRGLVLRQEAVLLLILVTYALSTALTETWATSLIVAVRGLSEREYWRGWPARFGFGAAHDRRGDGLKWRRSGTNGASAQWHERCTFGCP